MTDYFAVLNQQRVPWLDPAEVESAFLNASRATHPDRVHAASEAERFKAHEQAVEVNRAHLCLKNPRTRLRHFLELERGNRITDLQEIPADLMEVFMEVSRLLQSVDPAIDKGGEPLSPMLKVAHFEKAQRLHDQLEECKSRLNQRHLDLVNQLKAVHHRWTHLDSHEPVEQDQLLSKLETIYRLLTFHERWIEQLEARTRKLIGPL